MYTYRNFIFPCTGNEFVFYLPEHFSLLSRGAVLHSLGVSAVGITENVMITRYGKQHSEGEVTETPTHCGWGNCSLVKCITHTF